MQPQPRCISPGSFGFTPHEVSLSLLHREVKLFCDFFFLLPTQFSFISQHHLCVSNAVEEGGRQTKGKTHMDPLQLNWV